MASYPCSGCVISREPVPVHDQELGREVTGWEFTVATDEGHPVPIVVTATDRNKGLKETKKLVRKYIASAAGAVAPATAQS